MQTLKEFHVRPPGRKKRSESLSGVDDVFNYSKDVEESKEKKRHRSQSLDFSTHQQIPEGEKRQDGSNEGLPRHYSFAFDEEIEQSENKQESGCSKSAWASGISGLLLTGAITISIYAYYHPDAALSEKWITPLLGDSDHLNPDDLASLLTPEVIAIAGTALIFVVALICLCVTRALDSQEEYDNEESSQFDDNPGGGGVDTPADSGKKGLGRPTSTSSPS